jgi:Txe/YoeB family toxin of toxin-antitoxin system
LVFTKQAQKDARKLAAAGLKPKAETLLDLLRDNPFQNPPPFEKLVGDLSGAYSRRINIQHRLVYGENGTDLFSLISAFSMSDPQDEDRDFPFVDFIDDSISAHTNAPQPRKIAFEKFADVGVLRK